MASQKENFLGLEHRIHECKASEQGYCRKISGLRREISDINKEIDELNGSIKELELKVDEVHSSSHAGTLLKSNRRAELLAEQERLRSDSLRIVKEVETVDAAIRERSDLKQQVSRELLEIDKSIASHQHSISSIRQNGATSLHKYGESLDSAVMAMQHQKWNSTPIGPIGLLLSSPLGIHIRIKDGKWKRALDDIIGAHMSSFLVSTSDDREKLLQILQKHKCQNSIIVVSNSAIDVSSGEPHPNYTTALRILEVPLEASRGQFTEPSVRKALVILTGLEKCVLIEDRNRAQEEIKARPKNVDAIYTQQGRISLS